jgi:hypothetical protein
MLTARRLFGIGVVVAAGAMAAAPPAALAFPPEGGTETSKVTVGPGGEGETMTDTLPANATQGSINLQPEAGDDQKEFDGLVSTLVSDGRVPGKLTQRSKRILTCVYVSYAAFVHDYPVENAVATGSIYQALVLDACLQLALSFPNTPAAADAARSAAGPCARFSAAVTMQVTRTRSGYRGVINTKARPPSGRQAANISCRRSGNGLLISVKPRVRGQTLRKAIGPNLGVAFVNPTKSPVGVRTTFTAN